MSADLLGALLATESGCQLTLSGGQLPLVPLSPWQGGHVPGTALRGIPPTAASPSPPPPEAETSLPRIGGAPAGQLALPRSHLELNHDEGGRARFHWGCQRKFQKDVAWGLSLKGWCAWRAG